MIVCAHTIDLRHRMGRLLASRDHLHHTVLLYDIRDEATCSVRILDSFVRAAWTGFFRSVYTFGIMWGLEEKKGLCFRALIRSAQVVLRMVMKTFHTLSNYMHSIWTCDDGSCF